MRYLEELNHLKTIKKLLKTSNKILKDECGDPCILGKKGKIYTDLSFWYIYLVAKQWNSFKKQLDFMEVWQDGDSEGVLRADFPPSPKQAIVIRRLVSLGKKRIMSEKQRASMKSFFFSAPTEASSGTLDAFK